MARVAIWSSRTRVGDICSSSSVSSLVLPSPESNLTSSIKSTFFCLARVVLFRLFESPKFLAARGDLEGALRALRSISKVNGNDKEWTLEDVIDRVSRSVEGKGEEQGMLRDFEGGYEATGDSDSPLSGRASPVDDLSVPIPSPSLSVRRGASRRMGGSTDTWVDGLPVWTQEWVREYELRMAGLFEPRWKRTTVLVWCIWGFVSAGYTVRPSASSFEQQKARRADEMG